jgi:hypothetical protein
MTLAYQINTNPMGTGLHFDVPASVYFADPCVVPSLTQSVAKILIGQSPAHARLEHPRLAPPKDEEDEEPEKYVTATAIGNAAHALLIGRGKDVIVGDFPNWKSGDARKFRDDPAHADKVVILKKHMRRADAMVSAFRDQLLRVPETANAFTGGRGEVVAIADQGGIVILRTMIDWLHDDMRTIDDLKTTGMSAAPHSIPSKMVDEGWDIQAAIQERILDVIDPDGAGRRKHRFYAQENYEPFAVTPHELPESTMTMGRKKLDMAIALWTRAMNSGEWPAYPPMINRPDYPSFNETQWLAREMDFAELGITTAPAPEWSLRDESPRSPRMLTDLSGG